MELSLSSDRKLFREATRRFFEEECSLDRIRDMKDGEPRWRRDRWRRDTKPGWAVTVVPEELGGGSVSGEGVRDLSLRAEERGAGVAPGPLIPPARPHRIGASPSGRSSAVTEDHRPDGPPTDPSGRKMS